MEQPEGPPPPEAPRAKGPMKKASPRVRPQPSSPSSTAESSSEGPPGQSPPATDADAPEPNGAPRFGSASRRTTRTLLILALLLAAVSAWFGSRQAPHPDMWRTIANWDLARWDWWAYPLERNAFKRVVVRGDLRAVHTLPDASHTWAVGSGGLILHSSDAGNSWQQLNPRPAPDTSRSARGFKLLPSAHAQQSSPSNPPPDPKLEAANAARLQQSPPRADITSTPASAPSVSRSPSPEELKLLDAKRTKGAPPPRPVAPPNRVDVQQRPASAAASVPAASASAATTPPPRRDPLSADLNAVVFVDAQRGWIAGEDDVLHTTSDGGRSWSPQPTGLNARITALTFLSDGRRGWIVGHNGSVMATDDGGKTWRGLQRPPTDRRPAGVSFAADGQRGWVAGPDGLFSTADAGQSWRAQNVGNRAGLRGVHFMRDGRRGWLVGNAGQLLTSTDGGSSWSAQTSHTRAGLDGVSFAADGQLGFAVGEDGTLLRTHDSGATWVRRTSGLKAALTDIRLLDDGQRGIAIGHDGALLATSDGGLTWRVQAEAPDAALLRLSLGAEPLRGWAVGDGGTILVSNDSIATWLPRPSRTQARLWDVHLLADGLRGWAVGEAGTVLATRDGGQSWTPQTSGTTEHLAGVGFTPDGQRGWVAGDAGTLLATQDGGQTWLHQNKGTTLSFAHLTDLALTPDGQRIWVVGGEGAILASRDGGQNWTRQSSGTLGLLRNIHMLPDGLRGWAVGGQVITSTRDGGQTWVPRTVSAAPLQGLSFLADGRRGWAVGEYATVLGSTDSGDTWRPLAEYRRYPPPWMFAALVLAAGLLAYAIAFGSLRAPAKPEEQRAPQVLSALLTDSPLTDLNDDRLGHSPAVLALSDFMRNRDTDPRLTLAITAPWGMGKSSMMGMLRSELHKAGFRSAWFNAWHHQQEGRQLSALFNVIRQQAVPSIFSQPVAALRVRARLLWARGWAYRLGIPLLALPLLALLWADLDRGQRDGKLSLAELTRWNFSHHWLKEPRVAISGRSLAKLNPFAQPASAAAARNPCEPGARAARKPDAVLRDEVYCYLQRGVVLQADGEHEACGVVEPLIRDEAAQRKHGVCIFENADQLFDIADKHVGWKPAAAAKGGDPARYLLPSERKAIVEAAEVLEPPPMLPTIEHFIPLLALLGLFMTKGLSVYGLQLLQPLRSLLGGGAGAAAAVEPTGTVERYRTEFRLLTNALDGRLVVFIDDLDRCNRDTVNSMLEMTNYLIDHGKCFIVIGAAMEHVKRCIDPKAEVLDPEKYRTEYLRKIVHIELPVPVPSEAALEALLNTRGPAAGAAQDGWLERLLLRLAPLWNLARKVVPVLLVVLLAGWVAYALQRSIRAPQELRDVAAIPMPAAASGVTAAGTPATPASAAVAAASAPSTASGPAGLVAGSTDWQSFGQWTLAAALLLLGALWLRRAGPRLDRLKVALGGAIRTADSPQFMAALSLWKPAVRLYDPTPRGLKRFCNRARLFAIHERASHPALDTEEVHVVALTAIHHVSPALLNEIAAASRADGLDGLKAWLAKPAADASPEAALKHCLARHVTAWGFATPDTVTRFSELLAQISVR